MTLPDAVWTAIKDYEETVLRIEDYAVTELAKKIAYYAAMINAAHDDPFEDDAEQDEILSFLTATQTQLVETYQNLVNEHV